MKKRTELLTWLLIFSLAGSTTVYGDTAKQCAISTEEGEAEPERSEEEPQPGYEKHELDEGTVIAPTCTEKGYTQYRCKVEGCTYEEKRNEKDPLGHDLKKVSETVSEDGKLVYILLECQRENCDYQILTEGSQKEEEPSEKSSDTPEHGENTSASEQGETAEEQGETTEQEEGRTEPEPGETEMKSGETTQEPEKTAPDPENHAEELPEIDPDTEGEALTWAFSISTDIVTEYDPETAADIIQIPEDTAHPGELTEIEGRTVPEGTARVTRDSSGNITDLEFSMKLSEIKHGVSFCSETGTLKSVTLTGLNNEKNFRITLKAEKPVDELGIRLSETEKGVLFIFTEDEKALYIADAKEEEGKLIVTTSSGGSCEVIRENKKFSLPAFCVPDRESVGVLLENLEKEKASVRFLSGGELETEDDLREKSCWIRPYGDPDRNPVIIKIYEKSNAY